MAIIGSGAVRIWAQLPAVGLESAGGSMTLGRVVTLRGAAEHPWDQAHRLLREPAVLGLEAAEGPVYAEPDFIQAFPHEGPTDRALESFALPPCADTPPDAFWPIGAPATGWHLADEHSGLKA